MNLVSHIMKSKCHIFFETLGTSLKLEILYELKKKPLIVNDLSKKLNQERSKISHALKSLNVCKFVSVKKDGRNRIYSINKETILPLLNLAEVHMKKFCTTCNK